MGNKQGSFAVDDTFVFLAKYVTKATAGIFHSSSANHYYKKNNMKRNLTFFFQTVIMFKTLILTNVLTKNERKLFHPSQSLRGHCDLFMRCWSILSIHYTHSHSRSPGETSTAQK